MNARTILMALAIACVTGCVSQVKYESLQQQNASLQKRLERLERANRVQHEKKEKTDGGMSVDVANPIAPPPGIVMENAAMTQMAPMAGAGGGDIVYDSHGRYTCYVDSAPQVEYGPRVEIENPADSPYAKSLIVNGEEVVFLRANGGNTYAEEGIATGGAARNASGVPLLHPGESCVMLVGNARRVIVKSKAYALVGGTAQNRVYSTDAWGKYPSGTSATNKLDQYEVDPVYTKIVLLDRYYGRR